MKFARRNIVAGAALTASLLSFGAGFHYGLEVAKPVVASAFEGTEPPDKLPYTERNVYFGLGILGLAVAWRQATKQAVSEGKIAPPTPILTLIRERRDQYRETDWRHTAAATISLAEADITPPEICSLETEELAEIIPLPLPSSKSLDAASVDPPPAIGQGLN